MTVATQTTVRFHFMCDMFPLTGVERSPGGQWKMKPLQGDERMLLEPCNSQPMISCDALIEKSVVQTSPARRSSEGLWEKTLALITQSAIQHESTIDSSRSTLPERRAPCAPRVDAAFR